METTHLLDAEIPARTRVDYFGFSSACAVAEGDAWDGLSEPPDPPVAARMEEPPLIANAMIATKVKNNLIARP